MKALIVKLSAFGDIIHALPALADLRKRPQISEIHWLIDARYAFVSEILPASVVVHQVALKRAQPLTSAWQTIRTLRSIDFDLVFDLQGLIKSALLARAAGHPVFGLDRAHQREAAGSHLITPVRFHADECHVVQQYRRVAAAPFSSADPAVLPAAAIPYQPPRIDLNETHITPDASLLTRLGLTERPFVILHAAGGWQTKQLPRRTWIAIACELERHGATALFSWGSPAEQQMAQSLAAEGNGCALPERLNMSALCALLHGARAVVGADTGLLHLAAALGRPTITFWGPSASWRSAPLNGSAAAGSSQTGERHWHIESHPACGPCFKRSCSQFVCMDAIDPESITRPLIRILHEL
jgi:heptosyltransferase-1